MNGYSACLLFSGGSVYTAADAEFVTESGVERRKRMKGYEGCYYSEHESEEEGTSEHSKKKTNRAEESRWVKNVSCSHLVVSGDGTRGENDRKNRKTVSE